MDSKEIITMGIAEDFNKYLKEIENLGEEGLRRLQKEMRRYNGLWWNVRRTKEIDGNDGRNSSNPQIQQSNNYDGKCC